VSEHRPDMSMTRQKLLDQKVTETASEAQARGLDPFLCVIVLQTYEGLTVRGAADGRIVQDEEKWEELLAKVGKLVTDYCSELPTIQAVAGTGPS